MLQIDHEQLNQPIFQKQYNALYFNPSTQFNKKTVTFRHPCEQYTLPVYYLDTMREQEALYLLQWNEQEQSKVLNLKKSTHGDWTSVAMNHYPAHLAITDEHLFLFGSKELSIVSLISETVKTISLEDGKIVDLKLCFTESSESGVSVAYFSTKLGYFTKEYSKSSEDSFWSKLKTIFRLGAKDKKEFDFFQVLLPNLVGIALQGEQLVLYDLHKMTVSNLSAPFVEKNCGKYPPICLRFAKSSKGLSQAMHIYILVKNKILLYIFHVARIQAKEGQPPIPEVSLNSIARGSIIDWAASIFEKSQFEVTSEFTITDFIVSKEHLIFRQMRQGISEIPKLTKIALASLSVQKSIIPQESGIWKHYYNDHTDSQKFVSKFRMEINPEKQLIKQTDSGKKLLKIESDCIYHLNQWRHFNKFQSFLLYHGQIYIVRAHSIAVLEDISHVQYELQSYSEEDRLRDEELKIGNQLGHHKHKIRLLPKEAIEKEYKNILFEIKRSAELLHNSNNNIKENDGLPNKVSLLFNTLRDRLDYACEVIDYCESQLKIEEKSYKNKQIIRIIRYLSSSLEDRKQYQRLGSFFITTFIQKHEFLLSSFNQINIAKILKKLLKYLLPDSYIAESPSNSVFTNDYLQFLISYLLSNREQSTNLLVQSELKKIISMVYPSFQDKSQQYLFKNISFIKAYFLSHPQETQFFTYCQHLVKQTYYKQILQSLKQIFHLVPNELDILIKAEFSLKKNQLSSKIFTSKINHLPVSANLQRDYTSLAKQILSSVCKNESAEYQYEHCLTTIKQILNEISYSDFLTFGDVQPKLAQLYRERIGIDSVNEEYAQILQIQQAILICYINLLNRELPKINDVEQNFSAFQQFLSRLLNQIEFSFLNYRKFHKKLYNFNQKEGFFNMNMLGITQRVNEEQSLMSSGYIEEALKVQDNYLSQIFIFILKKAISDDNLLRALAKQSFKWTNNVFVEELLRTILEEKDITCQEIDILYFYLLKKGEKYMRRILSKNSRESCSKVVKYLERMSEKDVLYVIASEIEEELSCFAKEIDGSKSDIKI